MKLTFGKYKDMEIEDVPISYLKWLEESYSGIWQSLANEEIKRRTSPRSSEGKTVKVSRNEAMEKLAAVIHVMPDDLFGQSWIVNIIQAKFRVRIDKV